MARYISCSVAAGAEALALLFDKQKLKEWWGGQGTTT